MKMAVADNYISPRMYDKIYNNVNLPKYIKKKNIPLTFEKRQLSFLQSDFTDIRVKMLC